MQIEIWSDVMCPWCAVGKARFEKALAAFPHRDAVTVRWRSFELDPRAPREVEGDLVAALAKKYGRSRAGAQTMVDQMTATGAAEGLEFNFDVARPGNTFDAHRLLHLAAERGLQGALKARLFAAYLTEGEAVGQPVVLQRLAVEVGLDATAVAEVLAGDGFAEAVRADEREAMAMGVRGVPFFVIDRHLGLSGAQPTEVMLDVLQKAWSARPVAPAPAAEACDEDGCAI